MSGLALHLFAEPDQQAFAVLDGASVDGLLNALYEHKPESICLYRGELQPDIAHVAPYLVRLVEDSAFTKWVLEQGWGKHWGIFAVTRADLTALRQHFRRFLTVHDSKGNPLLFRYYDPRVLRVFLPTCKEEELESFFGPVLRYFMEGESPEELIQFHLTNRKLIRQQHKLLQDA